MMPLEAADEARRQLLASEADMITLPRGVVQMLVACIEYKESQVNPTIAAARRRLGLTRFRPIKSEPRPPCLDRSVLNDNLFRMLNYISLMDKTDEPLSTSDFNKQLANGTRSGKTVRKLHELKYLDVETRPPCSKYTYTTYWFWPGYVTIKGQEFLDQYRHLFKETI